MNPTTHPQAYGPFTSRRAPQSRRRFLRAAGVGLALPFLDSMVAPFARESFAAADAAPGGPPRRFFGICNNLGLLHEQFFPREVGKDYALSPYLQFLKEHRDDFSVMSGVSHPNVDGGHPSDIAFLTAAPHPASGSFRNLHVFGTGDADHIEISTVIGPNNFTGIGVDHIENGLLWGMFVGTEGITTLAIHGQGGNDAITLKQANPGIPIAIYGDGGSDNLVVEGRMPSPVRLDGGSGQDVLSIEAGADDESFVVNGRGFEADVQLLTSLDGTNITIAGDASDTLKLDGLGGNDLFAFDGSSRIGIRFDGGAGEDRSFITADPDDETFIVTGRELEVDIQLLTSLDGTSFTRDEEDSRKAAPLPSSWSAA